MHAGTRVYVCIYVQIYARTRNTLPLQARLLYYTCITHARTCTYSLRPGMLECQGTEKWLSLSLLYCNQLGCCEWTDGVGGCWANGPVEGTKVRENSIFGPTNIHKSLFGPVNLKIPNLTLLVCSVPKMTLPLHVRANSVKQEVKRPYYPSVYNDAYICCTVWLMYMHCTMSKQHFWYTKHNGQI
jgi:hypothetical protein